MFSNIIFFISALIIAALYTGEPPGEIPSSASLAGLMVSFIFFHFFVEKSFQHLKKKSDSDEFAVNFNSYLSKFSVLGILIFAFNIYILELPDLFSGFYLFKIIPTLTPVTLLIIFTIFMWILWGSAYPYFEGINRLEVSKREYIETQTGFALPSIFPWFLISIIFDLLSLLPFQGIKIFLENIYGQLIYVIAIFLVISAFIPVIVKRFWKCKELEDNDTIKILNSLSEKTGVSYKEALSWPLFGGRMITAGVIGLFKRFRFILVTPGFSDYLSYDEKEAVIAHEFGHVKKLHLFWYLILFMGFILGSYSLIQPVYSVLVFFQLSFFDIIQSSEKTTSLVIVFLVVICFVLYFRFIFGYFMRNFEREADAYSFEVSGSSFPLISTFRKISAMSAEPPDKPNWHHFSIKERVDFLLECQDNPEKVRLHSQKVKKALVIYFIAIFTTAFAGNEINKFDAYPFFINKIQTNLEEKIKDNPRDYSLYHQLGDLMIEKKDHKTAVAAYKKAISLKSDSVESLNNLAWLYITSNDPEIYSPEKGLPMAEKAVFINYPPSPHVLDTLAEGYYRTGYFEKSCSYSKKALEKAVENKKYYIDQVKKICR